MVIIWLITSLPDRRSYHSQSDPWFFILSRFTRYQPCGCFFKAPQVFPNSLPRHTETEGQRYVNVVKTSRGLRHKPILIPLPPPSFNLSLISSIITIASPPVGKFPHGELLGKGLWCHSPFSLSVQWLWQSSLHTCLSITEMNTSLPGTIINGVTGDN